MSVEGAAPLLSIVVLVYNTANYLQACFESLLTQNYRNIEIIAIDDGSQDESYEICQSYQSRHTNFRCVRKANEGGAIAGNLGLTMARGLYVALVDSDDLVTADGYALMMHEAIENSADVVIGRAARLNANGISTVTFLYEPFVWKAHRVVDSVADFPDLLHDPFYWNKIFRLEFLRKHGLGMEPGLLYADGVFVRQAYFYSQRTVIIPQLVYIWRLRNAEGEQSITQRKNDPENFRDRVRSMYIDWRNFEGVPNAEWYRKLVAVNNLHRALHVADGIVGSIAFRSVYMESMQAILELYGDLDIQALGPRRLMYLALIKRNEIAGLCYLLGLPLDAGVVERDGRVYWSQPFFNNPEFGIDSSLAEVRFPVVGFFHVSTLSLGEHSVYLELQIAESIKAGCNLEFEMQGLCGEGSFPFRELGRRAEGVYAYELSLLQVRPPRDKSIVYGLVMNYRMGDIWGYFRIGRALLTRDVLQTLPLQHASGYEVFWSAEVGGVGMRTLPDSERLASLVPGHCVYPLVFEGV